MAEVGDDRHGRGVGWTRRTFLAGLGAAALSLTGCSAIAGRDPSAPSEAVSGPDSLTFRFEDIEVAVPARPERVVVMDGRGDLEFVLLAGWPLLGVRNTVAPGDRPGGQYAEAVPPGVVMLESAEDRPNLEELVGLAPDLIVVRANSWRLDSYGNDTLARIAPVLPVEVNRPTFREDMIAQLGQFETGSDLLPALADYDAAVTTGRAVVGGLGAPPVVALLSTQMAGSGSVRWWTNKLATRVATDLGLTVLGLDASDEEGESSLGLEELSQVSAAGWIFHQTTADDPVGASPAWQALPAVGAGHAFVLDPLLNNGLALTATAIAERLTSCLEPV